MKTLTECTNIQEVFAYIRATYPTMIVKDILGIELIPESYEQEIKEAILRVTKTQDGQKE